MGFCQGRVLSNGCLFGEILVGGVFIKEGFCLRGFCHVGFLSQGGFIQVAFVWGEFYLGVCPRTLFKTLFKTSRIYNYYCCFYCAKLLEIHMIIW